MELVKFKSEVKSNISESKTKIESLDQLIKSNQTFSVKKTMCSEGCGFYLEKAFKTKNVSEQNKTEILWNLLRDTASNLISYLHDRNIENYERIKEFQ